jgi:hypothetical protein
MLKFYPAEEDCRSKWLKVAWYFSIEMKQSNSETPGQGSDVQFRGRCNRLTKNGFSDPSRLMAQAACHPARLEWSP